MATTMNITLPESMKEFVEEQTASGGYGTVSEYLRAVIKELQKRKAKEQLDAKLLEGARSPSGRMTEKRWAKLEQRVRKRNPALDPE